MDCKFLKVGDTYSFKPKTEGLEANIESGKVYNITIDRFTESITFKELAPLTLPSKIYSTDRDNRFISKALNTFSLAESGFTGILLSGMKGSGKTITAKRIAYESNLPIINISGYINPRHLKRVVEGLGDISVCFLFDEFDKIADEYDCAGLLQILDGVDTKGKHLIVFTCNNEKLVNDCFMDRCSRIRYWRSYKELSSSMIMEVLKDRLNDKKKVKPLLDFITTNFATASFDNVLSFVNEANVYNTATFEELFEDMNLTSK